MSVLNECLQLLENHKLKNLLLNGIELSNSFSLNLEMSDYFIENQHTHRKKQAAEALIKTNEYITYHRFIDNFRIIVDLFFQRISGEPYIIDTEQKTKSGFFCTMIFLFIIKDLIDNWDNQTNGVCLYYLPQDIIINLNINTVINETYIMQVNDMDYSANQLSRMIPKDRENYIVLRALTNSYALQQKHIVKLMEQNNYIFGEILHTFKETLILLYNTNQLEYSTIDEIEQVHDDVISFFADCSLDKPGIMNVYLDHKVADWASTVSLALTIGIIPNNMAYLGDVESICSYTGKPSLYYTENPDESETLTHPTQYIVPLINNCDYHSVKDNYSGNYNKIRNDFDNKVIQRCPFSWYKIINYQTGDLDLTNTRNTSNKLQHPLIWEQTIPDIPDEHEINNVTINNNNTDKLNKITEIIHQLTLKQIIELSKYVLNSITFGSKPIRIKSFLKKIKDNEILLTKTLNWDKLDEYLNIKVTTIGGRKINKVKISKQFKSNKKGKSSKKLKRIKR